MTHVRNVKGILLGAVIIIAMIMIITTNDANAVSETGRTNYKIMNGVNETLVYVTDSGNKNIRTHIVRINKGANVTFKASTPGYYKKGSTTKSRKKVAKKWKKKSWGNVPVDTQAKAYEKSKNISGKVLVGINGDFYYTNGMTKGKFIAEGNVLNKSNKEPFFAVNKNGSFAIMDAKASTKNVKEAIGGKWILKNGQIKEYEKGFRESRQAIGITADGDVIMVTVDIDPASPGLTIGNLANLMKQQGCVNALNFDGGGSTSLYTKRSGNKKLIYRNITGEAAPRTVSSALLLVSKSGKNTASNETAVSMRNDSTGISKNTTGEYQYKINGNLQKGFVTVNGLPYLFDNSGRGMTKTISLGKHKYTYNKGLMNKSSDRKAGHVLIDFCGAANGGQNLLYAYHYGDKVLNVGLNPLVVRNNGKMANWSNIRYVPWRREIYSVKAINIGNKVKNAGSNFVYISRIPFNTNLRNRKPKLKKISFSNSVNEIGKYAFHYQRSLRKVTIPAGVSKIGANAFAYNSGVKYTFKSKKPPKFGKKVFVRLSKAKKSTLIVPKTKQWKKYLGKKKNLKKIGFDGKIVYKK